jgi:hypothetical protein
MRRYRSFAFWAGVGLLACSSPNESNTTLPAPNTGGTAPTSGAGTSTTTQAGSAGAGISNGGTATGGVTSSSGSGPLTAGVNSTGGTAGAAGSGTVTSAGSGGGDGVAHALEITAAPGLHEHTVGGRKAGVDTNLPKPVGKLIVNVEVDDGGIYDYGIKHGFHVYGGSMFHCDIAQEKGTYMTKGRDYNGNCRWETLDGMDHDPSTNVAPEASIIGKVKQALTDLAKQYPEEGWPYYLDAGGNVRWSDVGFTGYSHGASSSIRWAKKVKVWRAVARSGPRDNICGSYPAGQCPDTVISSWLDEPSATPIENMYGLTGTQDSEYKDIVFAMERMKFVGALVDINSVAPPYNGSHRFSINGGHDPFTDKKFWPAMDVIWATPAEDVAYANSH